MKQITNLFIDSLKGLKIQYKYIYIAIDIHGTIFFPSRNEEEKYCYIEYAKETLQKLSENPNFKLILYSSSYEKNINKYIECFRKDNINIDYIMENPEVTSNEYANFEKKILL